MASGSTPNRSPMLSKVSPADTTYSTLSPAIVRPSAAGAG
jgi:hypothetical protein